MPRNIDCPFCDQLFRTENGLEYHIGWKHNDEPEPETDADEDETEEALEPAYPKIKHRNPFLKYLKQITGGEADADGNDDDAEGPRIEHRNPYLKQEVE